jgi:lipopolysaccharide biosynthesis regulator YciM
VTHTLAELYLKQGLVGRAREIYRKLAEQGDEAARQKLAELPSGKGRIEALQELLHRIEHRGRRALPRPGRRPERQ